MDKKLEKTVIDLNLLEDEIMHLRAELQCRKDDMHNDIVDLRKRALTIARFREQMNAGETNHLTKNQLSYLGFQVTSLSREITDAHAAINSETEAITNMLADLASTDNWLKAVAPQKQ